MNGSSCSYAVIGNSVVRGHRCFKARRGAMGGEDLRAVDPLDAWDNREVFVGVHEGKGG